MKLVDSMDTMRTRRFLLAQGMRLAGYGSLGALTAAMGWPELAAAQDWRTLDRSRPAGGFGTVKQMQGDANAAGRALRVGSRINSGEQISVAPQGLLILSLSDNTIMRINGNTIVTLEISKSRQGFFKLLVGSLLTVMPSSNRYLVKMPTATIGIKGTVFFQQIYHPGERIARDAYNKPVAIPAGINEYFCLCNGLVDVLEKKSAATLFSDNSEYHNSYYIDSRKKNPMVPAPQLNHTDTEIRELVTQQDGAKHDVQFLDAYSYKVK